MNMLIHLLIYTGLITWLLIVAADISLAIHRWRAGRALKKQVELKMQLDVEAFIDGLSNVRSQLKNLAGEVAAHNARITNLEDFAKKK